jgi:hypothetical protein
MRGPDPYRRASGQRRHRKDQPAVRPLRQRHYRRDVGVNTSTARYYLTTSVNPSGAGSITPNSGMHNSGDSVIVTATANSGYRFDHFSGDLSGSTVSQMLTMNGAKTVVANFCARDDWEFEQIHLILRIPPRIRHRAKAS